MEINKKLEELISETEENSMLSTLDTTDSILEETKEVLGQLLDDEGATLMEKVFAMNVVSNYIDLVRGMIDSAFDIEELECDEDCDNCSFGKGEFLN